MLIKNGLIFDAVHENPYAADIRLCDGKIAEIGSSLAACDGEDIFDAAGLRVYPGLVEAHCHTGLSNDGFDMASADKNENSDDTAAQMRAIDAFNPQNRNLRCAILGGVTTICTGPGSGHVLNGTFAAIKPIGTCVDDMILKNPVAMKASFGQDPKSGDKKLCTRMGIAATLRGVLFDTLDYMRKKENAGDDVLKRPKYNMKLEAMIPVLKGELPLKVNAQRADDICTAIRIAKEFDLKITLEHVADAITVVNEMARAGYPVAVGPNMNLAVKPEARNRCWETAGVLQRAGLKVSIISDDSATPIEHLGMYAGFSVLHGMDPFAALQAITINPAEHIGVADRVGSLEVGKDADVIITDGDIMDSCTSVLHVFVDGVQVVRDGEFVDEEG